MLAVSISAPGCRGGNPAAETAPAPTTVTTPEPAIIDPSAAFVRVELPAPTAEHQAMLAALGELGPLTLDAAGLQAGIEAAPAGWEAYARGRRRGPERRARARAARPGATLADRGARSRQQLQLLPLVLLRPPRHRPAIAELGLVVAFDDAALTAELLLTKAPSDAALGFAVELPGLTPPAPVTISAGDRCLRDAMRELVTGVRSEYTGSESVGDPAKILAGAEQALACAAEDPATSEDAARLRALFTGYIADPASP